MLAQLALKTHIFVVLMALILWQSPASAAEPVAKGSKIRDFHRLTFEWPRPTYHTAKVSDQTLKIRFERKVTADVSQAILTLKDIAHSYGLSKDGRTLTIKLKGDYRARSFVSGSVSGVDIISTKMVQKPAKVISIAKAMKQGAKPEQVTRPKKNVAGTSKQVASKRLAKLAPAAGEEKAEQKPKAEEKAETKPTAKKIDIPAPKETEEQAPKEAVMQPAEGESEPKVAEQSTPVEEKKPEPSQQVAAEETKPEPVEKVAAEKEQPKPVEQAATESDKPESEEKVQNVQETAEPQETQAVETRNTQETTEPQQPPTEEAQNNEATPEAPEQPQETVAPEQPPEVAETEEPKQEEVAPQETATPAETEQEPTSPPNEVELTSQTPEETEGDEPVKVSEPTNQAKVLEVRARLNGEELQVVFPWQKRTAAAAYVRNNVAWIVFNNVATLDLRKANTLLRAGVTIKQIQTNEATVMYMPISPGAGIEMNMIEGTFRWQVKVSSSSEETAMETVKVQVHTEPPLKPHVLLPFLDVAEVVRVKDPVIGDELDVLPVYATGKGVSPARSFPEFKLLDSVQGMVVLRKSHDTTVDIVRNGVRVSTHDGATITPGLPLPEEVKKETVAESDDVLLPYDKWKVKEGINYVDEIQLVKKQIARSLVKKEVDFFLRLAQLHLAYGEAVEALGYLQNIKRMDSDLYIKKRLSAMQGAANFLLHRHKDAARNFRVRELRDLEETKFWQVMLDELLGKPTENFDYEANYEPFIQYYPPILKQRIGIFAADRYIASKDYNAALKIFDQLNEHKLINEVADYINYLMGKIALETQKPEDGYKLWLEIIKGPATEFVKVRAEFALIIESFKREEITEEQATEKLEGLAMRWRGDNLELAVLSALSTIYEDQNDWPNAMRVWRAMDEAFPNTEQAVQATRKMDDAFVAIFDKGETASLTPLEQMFLYTEYRDLIPEDDVGDRIVENLANLMIRLDMLDQAADMLDGRMRYRFEHVDRSKVGAKLAEVYILDKKPLKALEALQLSVFGVLPEQLLKKRTYLSAQALLELNRFKDLFLLLEQDTSAEADYYRLQAHWKAKDWRTLADSGELVLKNRTNPTAPLTRMERDTLVKLALAYVALGEHEQTAYLKDYFSPLMKGQESAELFTYLTQPYLKLSPDNFDQVMQLLDETHIFLATDYGTKPKPDPDADPNQDG